jgi:chloramphenicol-sensitive protein RarD
LLWLAWRHSLGVPVMGATTGLTGLLLLAGVVSTTPLLLFTAASRRLLYSTLGMLQFIAPTLQFLIAIAYGEPLKTAHLIAFPAIWSALGLDVSAMLRAPRLPQPPE